MNIPRRWLFCTILFVIRSSYSGLILRFLIIFELIKINCRCDNSSLFRMILASILMLTYVMIKAKSK